MRAYQVIEVMNEATIAAASTLPSTVAGTECAVWDTTDVDDLALTVECVFGTAATGDVVVHVRTSPTGAEGTATGWDTEDYTSFTLTCDPTERVQRTVVIEGDPKYMKALVENKDAAVPVTDVVITKTTTEA